MEGAGPSFLSPPRGVDTPVQVMDSDDELVLSPGVTISSQMGQINKLLLTNKNQLHNNSNGQFPHDYKSVVGTIITIEPQGSEDDKNKFVGRSLLLSDLLKNSDFGKAGILDTRTNFNRKTISIQIQDVNQMEKLLKTEQLGSYKIKCTQPASHWELKGVISPIGIYTTANEIIDAINEQTPNTVTQAIRLNKGKEKVPSLSIKLIFDRSVKTLPEAIYIGYQRFKVRPFAEQALQCYKCQNYGHSANNCNRKDRCVVCAGEHKLSDCPKEKVQCANCGLEHTASYRGCVKAKEAQQINDIRTEKKITYREAVLLNKSNLGPNTGSRRAVALSIVVPANEAIKQRKIDTREVSCQTTVTNDQGIQTNNGNVITENQDHEPDEKMCAFIIECLTSICGNIIKVNESQQLSIISTASKKVYGKEKDIGKMAQYLKQNSSKKHKLNHEDDDALASTDPIVTQKTKKNKRK